MTMSEPTRFRSKTAIMAPTDWRLFSEALQSAFPEARYYVEPRGGCEWKTPRLLVTNTFIRAHRPASIWDNPITMVLDPDWAPDCYVSKGGRGWSYRMPRHPSVRFQGFLGFHRYPYPGCPPCLTMTMIAASCHPEVKEHFNFASRFYRLLAKFASNRNLEEVHYPSYQPVQYLNNKPLERLGPWRMVGHDARRWALEDKGHFLEFSVQKKTGLRPTFPSS